MAKDEGKSDEDKVKEALKEAADSVKPDEKKGLENIQRRTGGKGSGNGGRKGSGKGR